MIRSGHVLVVDDDPVIRHLMQRTLQSQGCEVMIAASASEALSSALAQPPDIILLDVMLPDTDGLEICQRIRAEPLLAEVPVIMITSLNDAESRLRSLEVGADDFITKPIDFIELRARVGSILRLNRYRRLLEERTQRLRVEEEMMRRNRELSLLNAFIISTAAKLQTSHHAEESLHHACTVLVQALDLARAEGWMLLEPQAELMQAFVSDEPNPEPQQRMVISAEQAQLLIHDEAVTSWVARGTPLDTAPATSTDWLMRYYGKSPLIAPITIKGRVAGMIALLPSDNRLLDMQERAFAQSLISALSQSIETSLLHQQLQRHAEHLEETVAMRTNELQAERDRTQAILEALGEAVIVTDAECIISYVNPSATLLTGYSSSEMIGRSWCTMQQNESASLLYRAIRNHVRTGRMWRGEVLSSRRDGSTYDAALTVAPIFEPQRTTSPIGMVSIQRDITPLKVAERMKDQFISNVSHELRTPLSIIALHSGNLDTLYDRLNDGQRRQLIREVRAQVERLDDLIGDILELSRIDSGQLRIEDRRVNLADVLRQEAEQLRPLAERKNQHLELVLDEQLNLHGDPAHLGQCVRNLISNAIKYTPQGGQISCECRRIDPSNNDLNAQDWPDYNPSDSGAWAGLRVVDTGIGIAPEHIGHLFERFYRVQNQTRVPGTGLGLAITRELITRHGGWTAVASQPGVGSIFAFYVPLAAEG
ncbi:multi-sensor signal transduction histidine kinase [Oscillochloris trichoides DG-6]|uniref:histidine kinase n=1 Tax=Oscillochloris trichoides DG-6 TaxID=765420 RepID=E1ID27_9CHLR|nr:response regulator [Oscillochloris trichoides]EFO80898.1 multi-sensor signal transduction histidine kinase [Oscillochloris trichoides DG-6]